MKQSTSKSIQGVINEFRLAENRIKQQDWLLGAAIDDDDSFAAHGLTPDQHYYEWRYKQNLKAVLAAVTRKCTRLYNNELAKVYELRNQLYNKFWFD